MIASLLRFRWACAAAAAWLLCSLPAAWAGELWVGTATTDITPDEPVALQGQFNLRVSKTVENRLTATALAVESRQGDVGQDQALWIACDLTMFTEDLQQKLRQRMHATLPKFDSRKLILTATHTHTAPVLDTYWYTIPKQGVMQPAAYVDLLVDRLSRVAAEAWNARRPGGVSWGLGFAVVGHNRRTVYADGTAKMYGAVDRPEFQNFESGEDHGLEMLFFFDAKQRPLAVAVNIGCPSQEVESRSTLNADFWHDVRQQLVARHPGLRVLGWPAAAGDQSPHPMYRKAAEERMRKLRGLTSTEEIARRIVREVDDVLELARRDVRTDVPFQHRVEDVALPVRKVTEQELAEARKQIALIAAKKTLGPGDYAHRMWHTDVVDRYQRQSQQSQRTFEIHAVRLGDVAVTTNPFEFFLDYGLRIKVRSRAQQTFILQLTGPVAGYLPTAKAVAGGGYSAVIESGCVGPDGGQVLVDRTVEMVNAMFAGKP
jgi:hypothetical protein